MVEIIHAKEYYKPNDKINFEEYLIKCSQDYVNPATFLGEEWFDKLKEGKYLKPNKTLVRFFYPAETRMSIFIVNENLKLIPTNRKNKRIPNYNFPWAVYNLKIPQKIGNLEQKIK